MIVDMVRVGEYRCNCYILKKGNDVIVIDPGDEADKIISKIGYNNLVYYSITNTNKQVFLKVFT